jgi:hypothetical protein
LPYCSHDSPSFGPVGREREVIGPVKEGGWFECVTNAAPSGLGIRANHYRQLRERSARSQPATELRAFGTEEGSASVTMNFMLRCCRHRG